MSRTFLLDYKDMRLNVNKVTLSWFHLYLPYVIVTSWIRRHIKIGMVVCYLYIYFYLRYHYLICLWISFKHPNQPRELILLWVKGIQLSLVSKFDLYKPNIAFLCFVFITVTNKAFKDIFYQSAIPDSNL